MEDQKPISRTDGDDVGCEESGFVGIGRIMQVMMVTRVILVELMVTDDVNNDDDDVHSDDDGDDVGCEGAGFGGIGRIM